MPFLILVLFFSNEATANDSTKKTEEGISADSTFSPPDLIDIDPLDYIKEELISNKTTPKETFRIADSIYKLAREELKQAPIENGVYQPDELHALSASMFGYLATIIAIEGYIKSKGIPLESLRVSIIHDTVQYMAVLRKIPGKGKLLASSFRVVFNNLDLPNYKIKTMNEGFTKAKFIVVTLKEEAVKGEIWEKTTANDSTEKTGKIQEAAPEYPKRILEMLAKRSKETLKEILKSRGIESTDVYATPGHMYPLDYQKIMLTGDSPKQAFWKAESIYKGAKEIFKKASIEDGIYQPKGSFYLFTSAIDGYLATLLAIDGYLLSKGVPPESLPTSVLDAYKYEAVLMKIPNKGETLVSYFWVIDNDLFIQRYEKKWEVKKTNAAFDKVKFIIKTLKKEARKEKGWR